MSNSNRIYKVKKYFALALDPIHVGTGGYRIGRVDNTIVREPATGIPKIPGTTIEGCCRSYAYLKIMENDQLRSKLKEVGFNQQCAKGKVKKDIEPCGKCSICITFGYTSKDKSMQAMALFSDARILFFPVATMIGPVWVTCPMVLEDAEIEVGSDKDKIMKLKRSFLKSVTLKLSENRVKERDKEESADKREFLNFGWLLLEKEENKDDIDPTQWKYEDKELKSLELHEEILNRIVVVPNDIFTAIVNSNLEVRTSVAIDPERGAVEEGALFTYEAIPRGTVLWFDVIYQNPKNFPALKNLKLIWDGKEISINENSDDNEIFSVLTKCVEAGLSLFQYLGVGGMGSRGFGRLRVLNQDKGDENDGRE